MGLLCKGLHCIGCQVLKATGNGLCLQRTAGSEGAMISSEDIGPVPSLVSKKGFRNAGRNDHNGLTHNSIQKRYTHLSESPSFFLLLSLSVQTWHNPRLSCFARLLQTTSTNPTIDRGGGPRTCRRNSSQGFQKLVHSQLHLLEKDPWPKTCGQPPH